MMQLILRENKSMRIKVLLYLLTIANIAAGIYFLFEMVYNCGTKFLFPSIVGILDAFFLICLRQSNKWNIKFLIAGVLFSILTLSAGITAFVMVENEVLCGNQFCISSSFNSADFLSDFKNNFEVSCSTTPEYLGSEMGLYSIFNPEYSDIGTIYYYNEFVSVFVAIVQIGASSISIVLLILSILAKKRQGNNNNNQPLIP